MTVAKAFARLLALNRWAEPHWGARAKLKRAGDWKLFGANEFHPTPPMKDWIAAFQQARTSATLTRFREGREAHDTWADACYQAVLPAFAAHGVLENISLSIQKEVVNGEDGERTTNGQIAFELLMLAQPKLSGLTLSDPLSIAGCHFPLGLGIAGVRWAAPLDATGIVVQGQSQADMMRAGAMLDFTGAVFEGQIPFTGTRFEGGVCFDNAAFRQNAHMTAARFGAPTSFRNATFQSGGNFEGASFFGDIDFSNARFEGHHHGMSFFDTTWHGQALLDGAHFGPGMRNSTLPVAFADAIVRAENPDL